MTPAFETPAWDPDDVDRLAQELDLSRERVRKALDTLRARGLLADLEPFAYHPAQDL